jgi:hypothetical protein
VKLSATEFYSIEDLPLQQGDILFGQITRVSAPDKFSPDHWLEIDELFQNLQFSQVTPTTPPRSMIIAGGNSLFMVTTHDCGLDKEFNSVIDQLLKDKEKFPSDESELIKEVESRDDLDRFLQVSPLIDPETVRIGGRLLDQGNLMSGKYIGYLPVPELVVNSKIKVPKAVVDLNYRATVDRLSFKRRATSITPAARDRLRFTMAKMDFLRTPDFGARLPEIPG